jgi:hypothetical protein
MNRADHFKAARCIAGVVVVSFALLVGTGCNQQPDGKVEHNRFTALGEVMAVKLNEMSGGKGSVVLVVGESDNNQPTPVGQAIAAFRHTLNKSVQITTTETVAMPAAPPPGFDPFSVDKFTGLLQKHEGADYLVSFVGVPVLTPAQIGQLPPQRPQAVEVVTFRAPTKAMFAAKVVCLAALARQVPDQAAAGRTAQEMFDAQYQVVTTETADRLTH